MSQMASPASHVYISESKGEEIHIQNGPSAAQVCGHKLNSNRT